MSLIPIVSPTIIPRVFYITNVNPGNDSPTVFDDISIGSGAATRDLIVAGFSWNNGSASNGLTVNGSATGVALVREASAGSNPDQARCAMYQFAAPAGSTCDLSLSFSGSAPGGAGVTCGIWRIKNLRSHTDIADQIDGSSPLGWTLSVSKYACIVAVASHDNDGEGTVTNLIRDYIGPFGGIHHGGHGQALATDAAYALVMSSGTGGSQCGIAAAWR